MLRHDWQPGEGTVVDWRIESGAEERWVVEIRPPEGPAYRVDLGIPGVTGCFRRPTVGQVVRMECDVKHRRGRWDRSDPALSWRRSAQAERGEQIKRGEGVERDEEADSRALASSSS